MKISRGAVIEETSTDEKIAEDDEQQVGEQREVIQQTQGVTQPKETLRKSIRAQKPNPKFAE